MIGRFMVAGLVVIPGAFTVEFAAGIGRAWRDACLRGAVEAEAARLFLRTLR